MPSFSTNAPVYLLVPFREKNRTILRVVALFQPLCSALGDTFSPNNSFLTSPQMGCALLGLSAAGSGFLGAHMTASIGGADMPVVRNAHR